MPQIVCLLRSHDLLGFIDGTIQFPLPRSASADEPAKEEEENGNKIEPAKEEEEKGDGIKPPPQKKEEKEGDEIESAKEEEEKEKGDEIETAKEEEKEKGDGLEPPKEGKKGDEIRNKEDYLQRNKSDELVKACIFGSLSDQLLKDKASYKLDISIRDCLVLKKVTYLNLKVLYSSFYFIVLGNNRNCTDLG